MESELNTIGCQLAFVNMQLMLIAFALWSIADALRKK